MKTLDTIFTLEKNRKIGAQPVWILKCPFASTGTLYLSDNVFTVDTWNSGVTTKSWVSSWGAIDENISFGAGVSQVSTFAVNFIIDQNTVTDIGDILWTVANNIETIDCELYLWFNGLSGASDPPELMWTGNIVDFRQINDQEYEVEFADQSVKNNKVVGTLLNAAAYVGLPPENVGKVAPIVYGSVTGHTPICVASGGYSELAEDLDTSETGIDLVDASTFGTSGYTINLNGEICTVTGKSGNTLTVTRSAVPRAHYIGNPVVQITSIVYLVADHPVKALNHLYVDGVEITAGYTFYTGQAGDEHGSYTGKAVLVIANATAYDSIQYVGPDTASGAGWGNPSYAVDGNDGTYAITLYDGQVLIVTFDEPSTPIFGVIKRQRVYVKWAVIPDVNNVDIDGSIGGVGIHLYNGDTYSFNGWTDYVTGGTDGPFNIWAVSGVTGDGSLWVTDASWKEITYTPYNSNGSTCEEVLVGGTVTCDIDGYQDDAVGTWTGTASALIERPDHIYKHFLYFNLGISASNFITDAAPYFAADSYKFGIVINEATIIKKWLADMAWQCRCYFRWALGKAYLLYRPDAISPIMDLMEYDTDTTAMNAYVTNGDSADQCSGGTALAESTLGGYPPAQSFDNNAATVWSSAAKGSAVTTWLCYLFGSAVTVGMVRLQTSPANPQLAFIDFTIKGSNNTTDGSDGDWTTLSTGQNMSGMSMWSNHVLSTQSSWTAIKIEGLTQLYIGDGNYYAQVAEMECIKQDLSARSESTIKIQGSYALKGIATITGSLNKTLTRAPSPTINLSGMNYINFYIRVSRVGSNIKIGVHDSGGTTTEITPYVTTANTWQLVCWDISAVSDANKNAIDAIIITIVNADAANTFYIDNMYCNDKTITSSMIGMSATGRSSIQVERSPLDEVVNKVRAKYSRNWALSGDESYTGLYETSDTSSIVRYGEKENTDLFEWDFISSSAMAADVGSFYLTRYKDRKKVITMDLFLDNCELEFADVVTVTPLSSVTLEIQKVNTYPGSGQEMRNDKIILVGREY